MPTTEQLQQHVFGLCKRHAITIYWCKRCSQSYSVREVDEITIAPIRSPISYATALHEIGHHLGSHQTSQFVIVRERWAWRWARGNALIWTEAMERSAQQAFAWYARAAEIDQRRASAASL